MKQRDLLFAGLLLFAAPAFAQDDPVPGIDMPIFDAEKDAKLIFSQNFEGNYAEWTTKAVDTIYKVEYYIHKNEKNGNSFKPWDSPDDWKKGLFRDSLIYLYNGVVVCDEPSEVWFEKPEVNATLVQDAGSEKTDRQSAMAAFGEADNGGESYFKFLTDSAPKEKSSNSYSNGLAARYRRNLFVRGLEIEDNTSYRLTFYAKANKRNPGSTKIPTLYSDIMRGYFHAEKPFTMGYKNDANNLEYNNKFEYTKADFTPNEWEKCTYMTYYLTDSIANYYVFVDGYWWAEDSSWYWKKDYNGNNTDMDLFYHVQPDKYFVRLGFASDSTEFCIDNLSLTRSTIGGVEYYQDKLRVNFGYETDLKKLAKAAYAANKIDAVEVPGDYFDVWGQYADGTWEATGIASAEYQGDGYMYMFSDFYDDPITGEKKRYSFDDYERVLVSFVNPTEPELELHYTGTLFPQATNKEWIRAGKRVLDFYNEEAALNPYVFQGIYSMYDRAPVMQVAPYEEGSFGLDGSQREFTFKFSREMWIDNPSNAASRNYCIVYVNDEIWNREWNEADSTLTITRPSNYTTALSGDVEIQINAIYVPNTTNKGDNVAIHYNFDKPISRVLGQPVEVYNTNFAASVNSKEQCVPAGVAVWQKGQFTEGNGAVKGSDSRLYWFAGPEITRAFCLSARGQKQHASLFVGYQDGYKMNLSAGNYKVDFKAYGVNKDRWIKVYVYPWDKKPQSYEDKVQIGEFTPSGNIAEGIRNTNTNSLDTILEPYSCAFNVEKSGAYIVEVQVEATMEGGYGNMSEFSNYSGAMLSDIIISKTPITYNPVKAVNDAVAASQARIAAAADAKYAGSILENLQRLVGIYKADATQPYSETAPSKWFAAADEINTANEALKLRMDTVDLVFAKADEADKKLADVVKDSLIWADLVAYTTLEATKTSVDTYPFSTKTNAELTAFIKKMDDEIKALDARVANNKEFVNQVDRSNTLITDAKHTEYAEYDALSDTYDEWFDYNLITPSDAEVETALATVKGAADAYDFRVQGFDAKTVRIFALKALAEKLGSDIVDNADVKDALENLEGDADLVADVLKTAVKLAIYEKAAASDKVVDSLVVSPFIKNYNLYQTPKIADRSDKQMPANNNAGADPKGANMQYTQHQYNNGDLNGKMPIWVMITNIDYTDLYPGWSVKAFNEGNSMITGDGDGYDAYKKGMPVFDGSIGMDWNSKAEMTQDLVDLPAGQYTLAVDLLKFTPKESDGKIAKLSVATKDSTYVGQATASSDKAVVVDSIIVTAADADTAVNVHFMLRSEAGWSRADNFSLVFNPDKNFNYSAAVAGQQAKMTELLTIVSPAKAVAADVEYYTLGGVQVAAPKAGQILIRKTNANGKVVVDKVLLK